MYSSISHSLKASFFIGLGLWGFKNDIILICLKTLKINIQKSGENSIVNPHKPSAWFNDYQDFAKLALTVPFFPFFGW